MNEERITGNPWWSDPRGEVMKTPDDVAATRVVGNDCAVEIDTNSYSVPWRLIGERVAVTIAAGEVRIRQGVREVAVHQVVGGRRQRVIDRAHLDGVAGLDGPVRRQAIEASSEVPPPPALLRPLTEYETAIGGSF